MRRRRHTLKIFLLICIFVLAFIGWCHRQTTIPGPLNEPKTVLLKKGSGVETIAEKLEAEGVIRSAAIFKALVALSGEAKRIKAGEYAFPAAAPMDYVLYMLSEGKVVVHKFTVPEGLTVREIVALLNAEPLLEGEVDASAIPEGALLPETYHFTYGDQRADLIDRMRSSMRSTLNELWPKRRPNLPFSTTGEALTLASIVEKETGVAHERRRVAAVYVNRLKKGMRLQADPTVAYGISVAQNAPMTRALTRDDLLTPTPYNTYTNTGLPPGPIANPGRASIEAALNPLDTKELFFVATGDGGHVFSETLDQHNNAVAAYRARVREKKAE